MIQVHTHISWGYKDLIEIFGKANDLVIHLQPYYAEIQIPEMLGPNKETTLTAGREYILISYHDDSETALSITCLSVKHAGFENMLCDYLRRCGVSLGEIPIGKFVLRKTPEQMETEWQEYRRKIRLA